MSLSREQENLAAAAGFAKRRAVQSADHDEEKSHEQGKNGQANAKDVAGLAAVTFPGLQNQGGGQKEKCCAARKRAAQNDPISSRAKFRTHRPSDSFII